MGVLQGTRITAYKQRADEVLDQLIEAVGRTAIEQYVVQWNTVEEKPLSKDGWVLLSVAPRDKRARPYVVVGAFDEYRACWRTQMGQLDSWLTVTGWRPLPEARADDVQSGIG